MACLATGLPWCVAGLALGTPELTAAGAALAEFAVLTALAYFYLPALKQTDLTLLAAQAPGELRRLLDGAVYHLLLFSAIEYYWFRDPSVQVYQLGRCQSAGARAAADRRAETAGGAASGADRRGGSRVARRAAVAALLGAPEVSSERRLIQVAA